MSYASGVVLFGGIRVGLTTYQLDVPVGLYFDLYSNSLLIILFYFKKIQKLTIEKQKHSSYEFKFYLKLYLFPNEC